MKVYLFTEGGGPVGMGHLSRCLALSRAFGEEGVLPVFVTESNAQVEHVLQSDEWIRLQWHKTQKFEFLKKDDVAIIDSYLAPKEICFEIQKRVKIALYIDDTHRIKYPPGVIINPNLSYKKYGAGSQVLGGPEFALLRPEFWDVEKKRISQSIRTIFLSLGSGVGASESQALTNAINAGLPSVSVRTLTGGMSPNEVKELLEASDLAICAAGQTLLECLRIGVPTIAVQTVLNQQANVQGFVAHKLGVFAGSWEGLNQCARTESVLKVIDELRSVSIRSKYSQVSQKIVDGLGPKKVVQFVKKWNSIPMHR